MTGDHLCIQCYEDLKFALEFKKKIENSCQTRSENNAEGRKRIIEIRNFVNESCRPDVEEPEADISEYEVLITSTSDQDVSGREQDPLTSSQVSGTSSVVKDPEVMPPISNTKQVRHDVTPRKSPRSAVKSPISKKSTSVKKSTRNRKQTLKKDDIDDQKEIQLIFSYDMASDYNSEEGPTFKIFDTENSNEIIMEDSTTETDEFIEKEHELTTTKGKTVVKRNKCQYCDKFFRSKTALDGHHRTHTGLKPYNCDYCKKGFAEMGNLRQHISSIHLNERKYSCEKCKNSFKTHYSHQVHIRSCITKEKVRLSYNAKFNFINHFLFPAISMSVLREGLLFFGEAVIAYENPYK